MPETGPSGHCSQEHTADTIVEAWGPTRASCLAELTSGLATVYADVPPACSRREVPVSVSGADDADLALALLEECLYLLDTRGVVAVGARLHDTDTAVSGVLVVVDVADVEVTGAIPKAVAVPDIACPAGAGSWRASVIVDV